MELMYAAEKRAQRYMHERDEARGLLRECRFIMAAGTVFTGDRYIDRGALRDRIDAFLGKSP